ncbi:gamma-glutamyltransferase family protein [Phycicoccus sp. Root101]|uniref:gamma-glutamyltransferase family protein n=1 Tax=Phycicoccus sp. Root101 TaxID=1736421 RepID=UPI0007036F44|nr:gamma-glutamyltransferase [Phycicoccus sp. Root101]KQU70175.1 hypothetical protein ASC58_20230 [Phycicoccus sp. Root101]
MSSDTSRWAVATPHASATDAAEKVFREGGNAVDAALAAASALTVVYPHQCSIGGDCIALVGLPDGTTHVVMGVGRTPADMSLDSFADMTTMPVDGALTVTVPGAVGAWHTMAERWGSVGLTSSLEVARRMASEGVPVAAGLGRDLFREEHRILADPGLRQVFAPNGRPLAAGEQLVQPRLAASLQAIAESGQDALYRGDLARSITATLQSRGSAMTTEDFAIHETVVDVPVSATYDGREYVTAPPPSQGAFFLEAVTALELIRLATGKPLDLDGPDAATVAMVLGDVAEDRDRLLGDPAVSPLDLVQLMGTRAREIAQLDSAPATGPRNPPPTGDTVAVVTSDGSGTWVSLIQSLFHAFGSGILDPESGIILHNRGASFSVSPNHPGAVAPSRRPPHTLMPVLTRDDGVLSGAHGTMGGRAQAQIHAQLALRLATGDLPGAAIGRPRWVVGLMEEGYRDQRTVGVEANAPAAVAHALRATGFEVTELPANDDGVGHSQMVRRYPSGLAAASDPRSDGSARIG